MLFSYRRPLVGRTYVRPPRGMIAVISVLAAVILGLVLAWGEGAYHPDGQLWYPESESKNRLKASCPRVLDEVGIRYTHSNDRERFYEISCGEHGERSIGHVATFGILTGRQDLYGRFACEHRGENCVELVFSKETRIVP